MAMATQEGVQMHLLQLPATVLVAVLDCMGDAGEVVRAATACKALWCVASSAQFSKVHAIRLHCYHPELQHVIPNIVRQFPNIHLLDLSNCSALPEAWLQPMSVWPLQQLNVTNLWLWAGTHTTCLLCWAPSLTCVIADGSALPIAAAVTHGAAKSRQAAATGVSAADRDSGSGTTPASVSGTAVQHNQGRHWQQPQQQQQSPVHPGVVQYAADTIGRPQQQQGCGAKKWPECTGQLQQLQLRRLLVNSSIRCRAHGSSGCTCHEDTLLSQLLMLNPHLTALDLSQNPMLPDRVLNWALTSNGVALQTLNLSGGELLQPGYVGTCCPGLADLDLSGTDTGDADLTLLAACLSQLSRLSLNGCRKVTAIGMEALAASAAVQSGQLQHLDIGSLTRTTATAVTALVAAVVQGNSSRISRLSRSTYSVGALPKSGDAGPGHPGRYAAINYNKDRSAAAGFAACCSSSSNCGRGSGRLLKLGLARTAGVTDATMGALLVKAAGAAVTLSNYSTPTAGAAAADVDLIDDFCLAEACQEFLQVKDSSAVKVDHVGGGGGAAAAAIAAPASSLPSHAPKVGLCGLELAACNHISGFVLQQLARLGLLSGLITLDLSDVEALRHSSGSCNLGAIAVTVAERCAATAAATQQTQPMQQHEDATGRCAAVATAAAANGDSRAAAAAAPQSVLGGVFAYSGSMLASLTLDGCHIDDATAAYIGVRCPCLRQLSLVGCRGLQSTGLRALLQGCGSSLMSIQLGGSHSRWREGASLSGLSGLTELRLLRRGSVTDAELAPILVANPGLERLALVGCYSCTDQLFLLSTDSNKAAACGTAYANNGNDVIMRSDSGEGRQQQHQPAPGQWRQQQQPVLQQHLTQLVLTACDSITGSSISRLRGLRHLRVSYCASFSVTAVQQIVLSCSKLVSLELPLQLQRQVPMCGKMWHAATLRSWGGLSYSVAARGAGKKPGHPGGPDPFALHGSGATANAAARLTEPARQGIGIILNGPRPGVIADSTSSWRCSDLTAGHMSGGTDTVSGGVRLPQQGLGGHLHGLKVVGI